MAEPLDIRAAVRERLGSYLATELATYYPNMAVAGEWTVPQNKLNRQSIVVLASGPARVMQHRRTDHKTGTITVATPAAPTVSVQGAAGATSYFYKIVAKDRDSANYSAPSAAGSVLTGNATLNATNFNRVTWTAVAYPAAQYDVYRSSTLLGTYKRIVTNTTALTADDTGLAEGSNAPASASANSKVLYTNGMVALDISVDLWADFPALRDRIARDVSDLFNRSPAYTLLNDEDEHDQGLVLTMPALYDTYCEYDLARIPTINESPSGAAQGSWRASWQGEARCYLSGEAQVYLVDHVVLTLSTNGGPEEELTLY